MGILDVLDEELLGRAYGGVTGYEWAQVLGLWVAIIIGFLLIRRLAKRRIRSLAGRTGTVVDDLIVEALEQTRFLFILIASFFIAVAILGLPDLVLERAGRVAFFALLVQVVLWGNHLITHSVQRYREARLAEDAAAVTSMQAAGFVARLLLYAVVVLLALENFGIDVTALVAGLGVGGIAVALAVQNILGDLFASLSIVLDKPFVVGDFLIVGEHLGTVEQIGLKTTRVRSLSGEQIIFSNSDLLKSRIRNYKRMFERRIVFSFGVLYETDSDDLARIPDVVRGIIEAQEPVRFDRAHFKGFGNFSLDFEVVYYVLDPDYTRYMDIQQAINLELKRAFEADGITFAYPTQTLYVSQVEAEA